jgi:hypothetical protein
MLGHRRGGCGRLRHTRHQQANGPDQTDVWFMQHMVPHLRQTNSIVDLARDRITRSKLTRLADTIGQNGQTHLQQLQGWLDRRGLAPHGHSHQGIDNSRGGSEAIGAIELAEASQAILVMADGDKPMGQSLPESLALTARGTAREPSAGVGPGGSKP